MTITTNYPDNVQAAIDAGYPDYARTLFEREIHRRFDAGERDGLPELIELFEAMDVSKLAAAPVIVKAAPTAVGRAPAISSITMLQATVWDYWKSETRPSGGKEKGDKKPPKHRFALSLELYTDDPATLGIGGELKKRIAFDGLTRLYRMPDIEGLLNRLVQTEGNGIERDYANFIMNLHKDSTDGICFGLLRSTTQQRGRPYVPHNFVRVEMLGTQAEFAEVWIDGEKLAITGWSDQTPKGNALTNQEHRQAIWQARMDLTGRYSAHLKWDSRNV